MPSSTSINSLCVHTIFLEASQCMRTAYTHNASLTNTHRRIHFLSFMRYIYSLFVSPGGGNLRRRKTRVVTGDQSSETIFPLWDAFSVWLSSRFLTLLCFITTFVKQQLFHWKIVFIVSIDMAHFIQYLSNISSSLLFL